MKVKTPSVRKYSNRTRKVKQVRRHHKKILRRIVQDLREVEEALRCQD